MANAELRQLWVAVRRDFARARAMLPPTPAEVDGSLSRFDEWINHNELELALDELESLGEDNSVAPEYGRPSRRQLRAWASTTARRG